MRSSERVVCVVGAGIVGASLAFHLSRSGNARVSIVDAGRAGAATTDAGTGWISARDNKDAAYRAFKLTAMEEHHRLAEFIPADQWLTARGTLQTEEASARFDALIEDCVQTGFPVDVMTAAEVNRELEPAIAFDRPDLRVAFFPTEFSVAGALLARLLVERAIDNGAIGHFGSRVVGLERLADARHRVIFSDGSWLDADVVVNAAGPGADKISSHYDINMPMDPQPGVGIRARVQGNPLGRMIHTRILTLKPETDGVLRLRSALGWRTDIGPQAWNGDFTGGQGRDAFIDQVVEEARRLLPTASVRPVEILSGVRPIPSDGLPRVGGVAALPGYYEAVMHSGAVIGPLMGRLLAEEILTGTENPALSRFRPSRFADAAARAVTTQEPV